MADAVLLERSGPVASLVLNRPDKHNALRFADLDRLVGLLHEAEEDDDVRVIVLRGARPVVLLRARLRRRGAVLRPGTRPGRRQAAPAQPALEAGHRPPRSA